MIARSRRNISVAILFLAATVFAVVSGPKWWKYYRTHVSTDNAYVQATVALVTPRIPGMVVKILVDDNWEVHEGDLLIRLDPTEYEMKLRAADAALALAKQTVGEERASVHAAESQVRLSEAELEQAKRDNTRVEALARKKVASEEDLDRKHTKLQVARARLQAARENLNRTRASLGIDIDAHVDESPLVRRAAAEREQAALRLSYTRIYAPISGFVTSKAVEIGQRVEPGQPLLRIAATRDPYVEANFKETQLADVRIGQPVTIRADAYPEMTYSGFVDGLSPGTGAAFALLPPENATGNWIKVIQRLPIKIRFRPPPSPDHPLRVGFSVEATIDVSDQSGPLLIPVSQREAGQAKGEEVSQP